MGNSRPSTFDFRLTINREPIAGEMPLDKDETGKIGAKRGPVSIALHETGHALGLGHSINWRCHAIPM